jgi:hypothetical protein
VQIVVQQPVGCRADVAWVSGCGEAAGMLADQVVQPVAAVAGLGEQVLIVQACQAAPGSVYGGAVERGGVGVDVGTRVQAQAAEQPLLI